MALSNFDFGALAVKFDRIMNMVHTVASPAQPSKVSRQADVLASIMKCISQIIAAYELPFRFDFKTASANSTGHSNACSVHFVPGDSPWSANNHADIDVDNSNGDQLFGFIMSFAGAKVPVEMLDKRDLPASARVTS